MNSDTRNRCIGSPPTPAWVDGKESVWHIGPLHHATATLVAHVDDAGLPCIAVSNRDGTTEAWQPNAFRAFCTAGLAACDDAEQRAGKHSAELANATSTGGDSA